MKKLRLLVILLVLPILIGAGWEKSKRIVDNDGDVLVINTDGSVNANVQGGSPTFTGDITLENGNKIVNDQEDIVEIESDGSGDAVLRVNSDDGGNDYISATHDGTNAIIANGAGVFRIDSVGNVEIDSASTGIQFSSAGGRVATFYWSAAQDWFNWSTNDSYGNQWVFINEDSRVTDMGHAVQTNPTLFIHSDTTPGATDEWISFTHDVTDAVINAGSGDIKVGNTTSGFVPAKVTSDPCGTMQEGSLFYNDTRNNLCYCKDGGAYFAATSSSLCAF